MEKEKKSQSEIFFKDLPEVEIKTVRESYEGGHESTTIRVKAENVNEAYKMVKKIQENSNK